MKFSDHEKYQIYQYVSSGLDFGGYDELAEDIISKTINEIEDLLTRKESQVNKLTKLINSPKVQLNLSNFINLLEEIPKE